MRIQRLPGFMLWVLGCVFAVLSTTPLAADQAIKLYVVAGQSNAVGTGSHIRDLPKELKQKAARIFIADQKSAEWRELAPPNSGYRPGSDHYYGFGPEVTLTHELKQAADDPIYFVKVAWGGTSLERDWLNPLPSYQGHRFKVTGDDRLYDRLQMTMQESIKNLEAKSGKDVELAGFFWIQGEGDASLRHKGNQPAPVFHEKYYENLNLLSEQLGKDFSQSEDFQFVLAGLSDHFASNDRWQMVVDAQKRFASENENVWFVDTNSFPKLKDNLHFTSQGHMELGRALAQAYLEAIDSSR